MSKNIEDLPIDEIENEIKELDIIERKSTAQKIRYKKLKNEKDAREIKKAGASGVFLNDEDKKNLKLIDAEIAKIIVNPYQPRKVFDKDKLKELSDSIVKHGLLQPVSIAVREGIYTLIAGERRLRAHKLANLEFIKATVIHDLTEKQFKVLSLLENLQRDDLNCIEEGISFNELSKEGLSIRDLETELSKKKTYIQERLKIVTMPKEVLDKVTELKLYTISKLYAISNIDNNPELQIKILNEIHENQITLEQVKNLARGTNKKPAEVKKDTSSRPYPFKLKELTGVGIKATKKKIDISIDPKSFKNADAETIKDYINTIMKELTKN